MNPSEPEKKILRLENTVYVKALEDLSKEVRRDHFLTAAGPRVDGHEDCKICDLLEKADQAHS